MKTRKWRFGTCRLLLLIAALVSPTYFFPSLASANELSFSMPVDVDVFDPAQAQGNVQKSALWLVFEGLYQFDADHNIRPVLAADFPKISADGTEYTISLRSGIKFHDGSPFNADVAKWGIERVLSEVDPVFGKPTSFRALVNMIKSIVVVDEYTLKIDLRYPYPAFINSFCHGAIFFQSKLAAQKYGTDVGIHPSGTGPFALKEWVKDEKIILTRNPSYWGEKPWADQITIHIIPEDLVRMAALENGEIDVATTLPVLYKERIEKNKNVKMRNRPTMKQIYMYPLFKEGPTADVRVRKALNYSVDREAVVTEILKGLATVSDSPSAPGATWYKSVGKFPYDPEKAKQLLSEAGYPNGITLKALAPTSINWQMYKEIMTAYVASMRKAGITLEVSFLEYATYRSIFNNPDALMKRGYQIAFGSWAPGTGDSAYTLASLFHTKGQGYGGANSGGYSNKEVDRLIEDAQRAPNSKAAGELLAKAQQIIHDDAAFVGLHYDPEIFAYGAQVTGLDATLQGVMLWGNAKKQ